MALTKEQVDKYLKNGGIRCPKCGSEEIRGSSVKREVGGAWEDVNCADCELEFRDVYTLTGVEEI